MDIVGQVCSLDSAKKLKGLGVTQDSLFWWCKDIGGGYSDRPQTSRANCLGGGISAFTGTELGEKLKGWQMPYYFDKDIWIFNPARVYGKTYGYALQECYSESEARAKMLIYLLENKIINSEGMYA